MQHTPPPGAYPQYRIVGLVGRAGAGKDTCADILVKTRGFARLAFADALRDEVVAAFSVDVAPFADRTLKERPTPALQVRRSADEAFIARAKSLGYDLWAPRSPREIMRLWGTEYRRQVTADNYWLERANDRVNALLASGVRRICFTDVRYANEAAYVTESLQGDLWRIRRRSADSRHATHSSEFDLERIQCKEVIHNELGLQELALEAQAALVRHVLE